MRSYRTEWQQTQEKIGKEIKDLEARIALIDGSDKLDELLATAQTAKQKSDSELQTIQTGFEKAETDDRRKDLASQVLAAKTNQDQIEIRIQKLSNFKDEIDRSGAEIVKNGLLAKVKELRSQNGGFAGLNPDPARPKILMDLSSAANNSFCFASPVGAGSAFKGGSYS